MNPYELSSLSRDEISPGLTRWQAQLVTLFAIVLLIRGGVMFFSWMMQLAAGFPVNSHFYVAILTKDAIYGTSALIGGLLLLLRHKLGWWFAFLHWCWYVACEVFVVATGVMLNWRIPVHPDPPTLYRNIGFTALTAACGLSVLLWRPIATACRAPTSQRYSAALTVLMSSVVAAFTLNWWMSWP